MPLFEITESCVSAIKSLVRAETEEEAKRKFYEEGAYVVTTREDVESQLESITETVEEEKELYVVASGYDVRCDCGHEETHVQLSERALFPRPEVGEGGAYVYNCPSCAYRHVFDGGDIYDAF